MGAQKYRQILSLFLFYGPKPWLLLTRKAFCFEHGCPLPVMSATVDIVCWGRDSALGHMRVEWSLTIWWNLSLSFNRNRIKWPQPIPQSMCHSVWATLVNNPAQKVKHQDHTTTFLTPHPQSLESSLTRGSPLLRIPENTNVTLYSFLGETWAPPKLRLEAWTQRTQAHCLLTETAHLVSGLTETQVLLSWSRKKSVWVKAIGREWVY